MRFTRRFQAAAGTVVLLGFLAAVTEAAVLLIGAVVLGAWLVGSAYNFVAATQRATDTLDIDVSVAPATVRTDTETTVTITAAGSEADASTLTVECPLPAGADRVKGRLTFDIGSDSELTSVVVTVPVAGHFEVGPCELTATDPYGLFSTTLTTEAAADLTVRPRRPRNIHVGEGGQQVGAAYGEHDARRSTGGLEPGELRQYVPGDPISHIDWNATARLQETYVREYEAQVERETLLAVDHRATMSAGPRGETKLDYARELALAVVDSADVLGDPLGLVTVGDEGSTAQYDPTATDAGYQRARTRLNDLAPTETGGTRGSPRDPGEARDTADRLAAEDSPMAEALVPLFADSEAYLNQIRKEPLFAAIRTAMQSARYDLAVIITDDAGRAELQKISRLLNRQDIQVVFYLLPDPLYDPGGLADFDEAYAAYTVFEEFRRNLARTNNVTAFEVAPSDRLSTILSNARESQPGVSVE